MRVLQLIDSLRPGGAEKMAVNIANALVPQVDRSFLCCTRQEGFLKNELTTEVGYLFLNKRSSFDPQAILKLRQFIKENNIEIVHAHSTSFFLAVLLKLSGKQFKFIWHDHYGESELLEQREFKILKVFSRFFDGIISVNTVLKEWAVKNLDCIKVIEIKNFIPEPDPAAEAKIKLKGEENHFKIICVANLRPQKDHFNLLKAFEMLDQDLHVSLHLVGEDPVTAYSKSVLEALKNSSVKEKIFYYGTQTEIISLLQLADLGVLSSRSEGLPLALLEYGMAGLPVLCTDTGQCREVVGEATMLVIKEDPLELAAGINNYIKNPSLLKRNSTILSKTVEKNYSQQKIISDILMFYK